MLPYAITVALNHEEIFYLFYVHVHLQEKVRK